MKTIPKIISLFFFVFTISCISSFTLSAQRAVSFQIFYDELSPYGTWVQNPQYGYVWFPNEGPGFAPYSSQGYWTLTDYGWTWVSYYPWGWAPFHYGRWYDDPTYGPMWVPDNEWGPGWVSWRRSNDYYGWAPIGPGVSLDMAYSNGYDVPYNRWTFVRNRDFGRRNSHNYYVNASRKGEIYKGSSSFYNERIDKDHHVRYNQGPERKEVEKHWGRPVNQLAVKDINKPGQKVGKSQYQIYRPQVDKVNAAGSKPAPGKVAEMKDVKPPAQRITQTTVQKPNRNSKQPTSQTQRAGQPAKQKQSQAQPSNPGNKTPRVNQPSKPQTGKSMRIEKNQQKTTQPQKQQAQRTMQPQKQQPQRSVQPAKQQPQRSVQPAKQQRQRPAQPMKQQQQQSPQNSKQPVQRNVQPIRQQQQRTAPPRMQKQAPPQQRIQQQQNVPRPPEPSRQIPANQEHKNEKNN